MTSPSRRIRKGLAAAAVAAVAAFGMVEAGARLCGLVDFPLYAADARYGYAERPNQHGRFLDRNAWAFNDRGLGVAARFAPRADGVLLVGDSVVCGGNPLRQEDKLGPELERLIHRPVWPLAAGGWALDNELQALKARPELLTAPTLVVVTNSGDFGALNPWPGELTAPTRRPLLASAYLLRKYLLKPRDVVDSPISPTATATWKADLAWLLAHYHGRLVWVIYPTANEIGPHPPAFTPLLAALNGRATIVDVGHSPLWSRALYRDGFIHPSPRGDAVLASIIANALGSLAHARGDRS